MASDGPRVVGYLNLAPPTDAAPPMAELVVAPGRPQAGHRLGDDEGRN